MAAPGLQDQTSQGWHVVREDTSWARCGGGNACSAVALQRASLIGHGKDECDRARERHVPDCTFGGGSVDTGLHDRIMMFQNSRKEDWKQDQQGEMRGCEEILSQQASASQVTEHN